MATDEVWLLEGSIGEPHRHRAKSFTSVHRTREGAAAEVLKLLKPLSPQLHRDFHKRLNRDDGNVSFYRDGVMWAVDCVINKMTVEE